MTAAARWRRLLKASGTGFGGFLLLFAGTAILVEGFQWREAPAYALMLALNSLYTFWMQQQVVFKDRLFARTISTRIVRFLSTLGSFRLLEWSIFWSLVHLASLHYAIAAPATNVSSFFLKYYVFDRWVFKRNAGVAQ
jgi:putative flippase GtrA